MKLFVKIVAFTLPILLLINLIRNLSLTYVIDVGSINKFYPYNFKVAFFGTHDLFNSIETFNGLLTTTQIIENLKVYSTSLLYHIQQGQTIDEIPTLISLIFYMLGEVALLPAYLVADLVEIFSWLTDILFGIKDIIIV